MLEWSTDEDFWVRRISIDNQLCRKENTNTELLEKILLNNLGSSEFFIDAIHMTDGANRFYQKIGYQNAVREKIENEQNIIIRGCCESGIRNKVFPKKKCV